MKKGAYFLTGEMIIWLNRIMLTIVVLVIVFGVINVALNREIKVDDSVADMVIRRLYYSSGCFALEDISVEPGVIDIKKFNNLRLKDCISLRYPVKAELEKTEKTIFNNELYESERDLCLVQNEKKKCLFTNKQYVLISDDGIKDFDILNVEVIIK